MTDYPYQPPEREFADIILSFQDMQRASTWSCRVEPDPLGGVNKIVTLMRGNHRVKSVLYPVNQGAVVRCGYDAGSPRIRAWSAIWEEIQTDWTSEYRPPTWYVEVDDHRVIEVPESETYPPAPPKPRVPLRRLVGNVVRGKSRQWADAVAKRLGYSRTDDDSWDE